MHDHLGQAQHSASGCKQVGDFEWLYQAEDLGGIDKGANTGIGDVAENKDRLGKQAWPRPLDPAVNIFAGPFAGDFAGQENGVKLLVLQVLHRLRAGRRRYHIQSGGGKHFAFKVEYWLFIVQQQDAPFQLRFAPGDDAVALGHRLLTDRHRQADLKHGASLGMVLGGDLATVFLHDAVTDAQSQPGAFAHAFGGVERIENVLGINDAGTGIMELADHVSVRGIDPDSQVAAACGIQHGVGSVVDDVEINLLQLVWISHHRRQDWLEITLHNDVMHLQVVVAKGDGVFHHAAQVHVHSAGLVLAPARKEVLHDLLRAYRLLAAVLDEVLDARLQLLALQQLCVAHDGGNC